MSPRPPKEFLDDLMRLRISCINRGCRSDLVILMPDADFRRVLWPRRYAVQWARESVKAQDLAPEWDPEEATLKEFMWNGITIRRSDN